MKRLSINSQDITKAAYEARQNYNAKAKRYNDTIKSFKQIKINPSVIAAIS